MNVHGAPSCLLRGLVAAALLLCLLWPAAAEAHKVSVFAYVDGANLVIDAFYSKSNKVNHGKISIRNAATGEDYLQATTDENGALTVPVPAKAVAARADLRILLAAGEGHQDEVLVKAAEYAALAVPARAASPAKQPPAKAGAKPALADAKAASAQAVAQQAPLPIDEAALARIVEQAVERAVDSRMAPVKRLLLESSRQGPGPTEIIGGIGYIVGLFGVAAFLAARRKDRSSK